VENPTVRARAKVGMEVLGVARSLAVDTPKLHTPDPLRVPVDACRIVHTNPESLGYGERFNYFFGSHRE